MQRLGVAYNAFDGLELLEASIDCVRPVASYVCVVYQIVSNFGEKISEHNLSILKSLKESGKIDEMIQYDPIGKVGHPNEIRKRNIGKVACQNKGMTHFMTMDVDEFYITQQLVYALESISTYDTSVCQMQTYYKSDCYALDPPEEYFVPLIYKMDNRTFDLRNRLAVPVDPTRRLTSTGMKVFSRAEIEMHHMSYVRRDISEKLRNSSAQVNFFRKIDKIVDYFNHWTPGKKAYLAGREERFYNLKQVDSMFKIKID